jgi:hypothetical protein
MLSLDECRKLIPDPQLSDEQVLKIRDACHELAEITLDYIEKNKKESALETTPQVDNED